MCHDGRRLEEYRETHTNVTGTGPHLEHIRIRPRAVFLKGQHGAQCRRERDQADDDAQRKAGRDPRAFFRVEARRRLLLLLRHLRALLRTPRRRRDGQICARGRFSLVQASAPEAARLTREWEGSYKPRRRRACDVRQRR